MTRGRSSGWTTVPGPGVWHETAPTKIPSEPSDLAHHVGRGDCHVEVDPSAFDALDQVVVADEVRAGLLGDGDGLAVGEDRDEQGLADTVGKHGHAADDLVGVTGVGPGANVKLDGLIELGGSGLLDQCRRFGGRIVPTGFNEFPGGRVSLCCCCHGCLPFVGQLGGTFCLALYLNADTAGGALDYPHGAFDVRSVEVLHLGLGDLSHLVGGNRPDLFGKGVSAPLLKPCGL